MEIVRRGATLMRWNVSHTILTTPRREPYLERTLKSLMGTRFFDDNAKLPLRLVAGSPQLEHLDPYRKDPRLLVDDMPKEEAEGLLFSSAGVPLRATWGHHRCLHPWRAKPGSDAVLVMEDDISFARDWMSDLDATIEGLISASGNRWALSLYTPHSREPLDAHKAGRRWITPAYEHFYGAQAILYPVGIRDEYMAYLVDHTIHKPHDLALPQVLRALGIPLYATAPCLVQHMGSVSQGVSGSFHRSDSFLG